jgi:hydrogenase nickel incorporation protein HypB
LRDVVKAGEGETFDIELEANLLKANEQLAERNKKMLSRNGVVAVDVMGSIGAGKTSLIEQLVKRLKERHHIAVLNGDLTTTIDADILGQYGIPVVQINTGKECHLDANLVEKALKKLELEKLNLIFVENVGNLICPAEFPLGSEKRIVVISLTEGPYIVVKHPYSFLNADAVVINKVDLADAMGLDIEKLKGDIRRLNPNVKLVETNCRTGDGVAKVADALGL